MRPSLVAFLFASLAGVIAACSSADAQAPIDPPAVADAGPAGDAAPAVDSGSTARPTACSEPLVDPKCSSTTPAPTSEAEVSKFVKDNGVPLRCGSGKDVVWDLRPLVQLYGDQKMFMVGEVHGSNEIGIMSSLLLEELATKKLVNVLAYELPMDFEAPLQNYVETGKDALAEHFVNRGARNMFGAILTKTARDLFTKGIKLKVGAVDIPTSPEIAEQAIREVAAKLTTQKDTVLATLPSVQGEPTTADFANANAYFDLVTGKKTEICAELSAADCDRLVAMTHALWASTLQYDEVTGQGQQWFARREEVIYYNMHAKMPAATDRMFLHMGAHHTNKHVGSAGSRMAKEWPGTKGQVFSIAPAYGDGSVIFYGQDMDLPGEPQSLVAPLTQVPPHPVFVSVTRPSAACVQNPLEDETDGSLGEGTLGQLYDGYIHYGKLTSERRPTDATISRDDDVLGKSLAAFRARVERRERAAFAAGGLGKRGLSRR